MEKKLVSIIVPVYNIEDYIETCINSILNQTKKTKNPHMTKLRRDHIEIFVYN